jgi:hypothetical protein
MSTSEIKALEERIERIKQDLVDQSGRKYEVLIEYKSYLEDELEMLKREQRQ